MKEMFFAIALVLTSLPVLATNTHVPTEINIPQAASISSEVGSMRLPFVVAGDDSTCLDKCDKALETCKKTQSILVCSSKHQKCVLACN